MAEPSDARPDYSSCAGSELQEDCLISILRKTEGQGTVDVATLADFLGVDTASLRDPLSALQSADKVTVDGENVGLTDYGLILAREVRKKHHVMENFLVNVLGMDHMSAHREAHQMEHTMSQESMQKLCHVTGNQHDSDCSACNNPCNTTITIGSMEPLHDMKVHTKGKIAYLKGKSPEDVKKLISMGFVPGRDIEVESRISAHGPRIVSIGGSTVAVDAELSKAILINVGA